MLQDYLQPPSPEFKIVSSKLQSASASSAGLFNQPSNHQENQSTSAGSAASFSQPSTHKENQSAPVGSVGVLNQTFNHQTNQSAPAGGAGLFNQTPVGTGFGSLFSDSLNVLQNTCPGCTHLQQSLDMEYQKRNQGLLIFYL